MALEGFAFVVILFAAGKTEFDLGPAVFEIQLERDQRQAAFLGLAGEPFDLAFVQEQLAQPRRLVVELVRARDRR